jgi:hypothetical protein
MSQDILAERWLPVVGFLGYDVSDFGRVRSYWNRRGGFNHQPHPMRLKPDKNGYMTVCLQSANREITCKVHRLVLEAFVGPCPEGMECRHFPDRNPANNLLANLSWARSKVNASDRWYHGTQPHGRSVVNVKLTDSQVKEIRKRRADGESLDSIKRRFAISRQSVSGICNGISWAHIPGPRTRVPWNNQSRGLTANDAAVIRDLFAGGMLQKNIAARYGISQTMVSRIVLGKTTYSRATSQPESAQ